MSPLLHSETWGFQERGLHSPGLGEDGWGSDCRGKRLAPQECAPLA